MLKLYLHLTCVIGLLNIAAGFDFSLPFPQLKQEEANPDIYLTVPQIIRRHGYQAEMHTVLTEDGYLLGVHRIPNGKNPPAPPGPVPRPVVFLQHGIVLSSADYTITGPEKSLAFQLADRGYDVWLGNARGNTYSKAHVSLKTDDKRFWEFSWDEMGGKDVPAVFDHILALTGVETITYIGHSLGCAVFLAFMSLRPEYIPKVNLMIALAPAVFVSHTISPIRFLAQPPWEANIEKIEALVGNGKLLPTHQYVQFFNEALCHVARGACRNIIFMIGGFDEPQLNQSLIPVIVSHTPSQTSAMTLIHYLQAIQTGEFGRYDYGPANNEVFYNSETAPVFDLKKVTPKIAIFASENDPFVLRVDIEHLILSLPNVVVDYTVPNPLFTHLDFIYGSDAPELVNQKAFEVMEKFGIVPNKQGEEDEDGDEAEEEDNEDDSDDDDDDGF